MRIQKRWVTAGMALLGGLTAACGTVKMPQAAATVQLVASYPRPPSGGNPSAAFPDGPAVLETVYLTLEVSEPDEAAEKAARAASGFGGYENNRYAWYADRGRAVSQEIYVPLDQAENFRARLLQLGWKAGESVVRHPDDRYGRGYAWAQFSIQYLRARPAIEWDHSLAEQFLEAVCGFAARAAAVLAQAAASLLLAAAVVIPIAWMVVGAVTSVRWLLRK